MFLTIMRHKIIPWITILLVSKFGTSCASSAPKKEDKFGGEQTQSPIVNTSAPLGCGGASSAYIPPNTMPNTVNNNFAGGAMSLTVENLDGNNLHVSDENATMQTSLCNVLNNSGKKVAIFQIVGVLCLSCQGESTKIQNTINNNPTVQHYLVFADAPNERSSDGVQNFVATHAFSRAIPYYDPNKVLWQRLAENTKPVFGTTIALNRNSQAIRIKSGEEIDRFVSSLNSFIQSAP